MKYNNVKQNKIIFNINKMPILKFDSLLLVISFVILLYSLSLLVIPNFFQNQGLYTFTINHFV
ncbi:MAG: hypothetical protein HeimC3_08460, partial [Candidatus Heimdallarchaeota archaeon LC_3]